MPVLDSKFHKQLLDAVNSLRDDVVRDTSKLIQFETISGGKTPEEVQKFNTEVNRCLDYLKKLAEANGLVYRDLDGIVSVIEKLSDNPSGEKGLGIPLHIDVVPVSGDWTQPPFSGTVADGCIWGRGTQDDKGPLVACLYALIALKKAGAAFTRPVHIILGKGEEIGEWSDVQYFIKKEGYPAFSFTPDAQFPIINGEKGIMNLKINAAWDRPDSGGAIRFTALKGGNRANVVPDAAEVFFTADDSAAAIPALKQQIAAYCASQPGASCSDPIADGNTIKAVFHGKSAHGSLPHEGHNAILDAIGFLASHKSVSKECAAWLTYMHKACSALYGEELGIAGEHHFVGKTTINLGVLHTDEKGGKSQINVRPTLGMTCADLAATATGVVRREAAARGIRMDVEQAAEWGRDPLFVDPEKNAFFISSLQTAYEKVTGRHPELMSIGGTTFAKAFPSCVCYGPVDPAEEKDLLHMTDERVEVEHQMRNVRIYAYAIGLLVTDAPTQD